MQKWIGICPVMSRLVSFLWNARPTSQRMTRPRINATGQPQGAQPPGANRGKGPAVANNTGLGTTSHKPTGFLIRGYRTNGTVPSTLCGSESGIKVSHGSIPLWKCSDAYTYREPHRVSEISNYAYFKVRVCAFYKLRARQIVL